MARAEQVWCPDQGNVYALARVCLRPNGYDSATGFIAVLKWMIRSMRVMQAFFNKNRAGLTMIAPSSSSKRFFLASEELWRNRNYQ